MLVLIALVVLVWLLIQTGMVQNWLVRQVTQKLSRDLETTVSIKHVDFALFDKMLLEGTLIKDRQQDTLLYAGTASVRITDWFFFKDKIELKYIGLQDATIYLQRKDSIWNYQFLVDYFIPKERSPKKKKNIELNLNVVELDNIAIVQRDAWRGENLSMSLKSLDLTARQVNFARKNILIKSININRPSFAIYNYSGTRPTVVKPSIVEEIINDPNNLRWNKDGWNVEADVIKIENGAFRLDKETKREPYPYFDGQHIFFSDINATFSDLKMVQDSLITSVVLSTKERSGFVVKKLTADMRMHPEAMEFFNLDLQTNRSRLRDFFAMRYSSFNDMSRFISKVRMEGIFEDSEINSEDIAFFAPAASTWKKRIRISGHVKGSVEDLNAQDLVIEAGRDTYLSGDALISGLPNINQTYIDFEASNLRTTYNDAIAFIPSLRRVQQPRLALLGFLNFKGNFTGFIRDFVTYGTIQTRLGSVTTDLNMKIPDRGLASYSGRIRTGGFQLGQFVGSPQVGKIAFTGKVDGSGLNLQTLNANLDGTIQLLEFNSYAYQNISVKGNVSKELFNGELISYDPNLDMRLTGLIDFSKKLPQFNFEAVVGKADLKKLNLINEQIDFSGKFLFDFEGDNIDNFLGSARIYEASIYKSGKRITFDSLYVESKIVDNNKVLTALSNEFDAALAGEFSIMELPAAVQTFLNKYYPNYVKPSRKVIQDQNFSFVVTTKNVDEYIQLLSKRLSGFDNSTITGRINTRSNLLDLNVEIPQLGYKNIVVSNLDLDAKGTYDSLVVQSTIADVMINDSLHFPGTTIKVKSSNDLSDVSINTSASKTLNAAHVSAQVNTLPDGVRINFNESTFDISGKTWTIDDDGELVLSRSFVSAEGIRIYSGMQEILVTTVPSDIGNTNDIRLNLKKVNIGDFAPYFLKKNRMEGLLTADVDVTDPFGKAGIEVSGIAEQFRWDDDSIGRVRLTADFSSRTNTINYKAIADNEQYNFDVAGNFRLADSTRSEELNLDARLNPTRVDLIKKYLSTIFSEMTGFATGDLRVTGPLNNLKYLGKLDVQDARVKVTYTDVVYKIPAATFNFREDRIDFGTFAIEDTFQNRGAITRGVLYHQGFKDLRFDFAMNTNRLLVLNTNSDGDNPFYGTVIARANMTLQGPLEDMVMDIEAEPVDSSSVYIDTKTGRESGQAPFIVWKVYGREMEDMRLAQESNLTVRLDVTANNLTTMYVIIDDLTGDIIRANGRGNLLMRATTSGEFILNGRYDIDRGIYNFNFQSLLKKPFRLREGVGNYIQWTGDPNNANIKIDAEYEAENVRFSDLGTTIFGDVNNNVLRYRGKVLVLASLSGELMSPKIRFQLELPPTSDLKNDPDALRILTQIQNDENELNKQVAFLIVFNSFGPLSTSPNQGIGNLAFEGLVVNSISGVLSNTLSKQFSNVFQKIFNDKSIRVNFNAQLYSGTNFIVNSNSNPFTIDRTNLNLSVAKSIFNERLTFTFGSSIDFGLTSQQVAATRNLEFLPDITAEWKISPEGRFVLTFFYRDSYNYLSGAGVRQNRSGASISYRREFDHIGDLLRGSRKKSRRTNLSREASAGTE